MEQWKVIRGFAGAYMISNHGRVKSVGRWRNTGRGGYKWITTKILKRQFHQGYVCVSLCKPKDDRSGRTHFVHKLVGRYFVDNPTKQKYLNHKDRDKNNCMASNLEWCSNRENATHSTLKKEKTSIYTGVWGYRNKEGCKNPWAAEIYYKGKRIKLGYFPSEELAARAYKKAVKKYGISNKYIKLINN